MTSPLSPPRGGCLHGRRDMRSSSVSCVRHRSRHKLRSPFCRQVHLSTLTFTTKPLQDPKHKGSGHEKLQSKNPNTPFGVNPWVRKWELERPSGGVHLSRNYLLRNKWREGGRREEGTKEENLLRLDLNPSDFAQSKCRDVLGANPLMPMLFSIQSFIRVARREGLRPGT